MSSANFEKILSFSNPVFSCYAYWGAILIIKCLLMSTYTGLYRFKKRVTSNPEDAYLGKLVGIDGSRGLKVNVIDPDIERVRRAHLNDLENIIPYLFAGLFYVLTNPSIGTAALLFRVAAISRIVHTIVYSVIVIPQPARLIAWLIPYLITIYMAVSVFFYSK